MPKIRLSYREVTRDGNLPDVCAVSGEPSSFTHERRFSWYPQWVIVLILVNLIVFAVVASVMTKRMTVHVPLSERYRGYWWKRTATWAVPLFGSVMLGITAIILAAGQQGRNEDAAAVLGIAAAVVFVGSLVVGAILTANGVRAVEITEDTITLAGVHQNFVDAVEDARDVRRAERDAREAAAPREDRRRRMDYGDEDGDDRPRRRRSGGGGD